MNAEQNKGCNFNIDAYHEICIIRSIKKYSTSITIRSQETKYTLPL